MIIKQELKKILSLGLIGVIIVSSLLASTKIDVFAHNAYFVAITIDEANFRYIPEVVFEENSWVASNHRESELGSFGEATVGEAWSVPTTSSEGKSSDEMEDVYKDVVKKGNGEKALIYTFPSLHGKGIITEKVHANGEDLMLANRYADYVVSGLNDALNFCITQSGAKGKVSIADLKVFAAQLANASSERSGEVSLNNKTFTISAGSPSKIIDGLSKTDYIKISTDEDSLIVPFQVRKGYVGSNPDRTGLSDSYIESITSKKGKKDTEYLDWKYTVLQGNYNADVKAITYSSSTDITKPSQLTIMIADFLSNFLNGLRSMLGLYAMEDLMLNSGARDAGYFYGIMPNFWMNSASLLHVVCQIVAWSLMGLSLIRMLYKRQLQTMNIGERISLMEGFKNLILTAFLLGSFILIFNSLSRVNYTLVNLFGSSSAFSGYIGTTQSMNAGAIASIVINIAFFVLSCYFNFFYILRGITIALLFGIAPLCIFMLTLGGKYTQIFNSFMKELVSNIFIQTFHAICVAFFTSVTSTSQMKTFELLVVFMSFIPLTNFVRQNIFGLSGGITDHAQSMVNMGRATVTGITMGAVGSTVAKSGYMNGGNIHANGSTMNGMGVLSNAMSNRKLHQTAESIGRGGINNSELFKNVSGDINTNNASNKMDLNINPSKAEKVKNVLGTAGTAVRGGTKIASGLAIAGSSIGFAAMGDKLGVSDTLRTGTNLMRSGMGNLRGIATGNVSFKDAGISEMYDGGEHMTTIYDAKIDDTTKQMTFSDQAINNSNYGRNLKEMYNAFNGKGEYAENGEKAAVREQAIDRYKKQGIMGVGTYKDQLAIVYDKKAMEKKNWIPGGIGGISPYQEKGNSFKTMEEEMLERGEEF